MENTQLVIYVMDLIGTAAFALSGALRALDRRPDFIGMLILASITAIGGGIVRDAILGRQAAVLGNPMYITVIVLSVMVLYVFPMSFWRRVDMFKYFDAFGYGVFTGIAANIGVRLELNLFAVQVLAVLTACGGGVIRDVIIQKQSLPLSDELYVIPVLLGSSGLFVAHQYNIAAYLPVSVELFGFLVALVITTGLRLLAIAYNLRLPRVRYGG